MRFLIISISLIALSAQLQAQDYQLEKLTDKVIANRYFYFEDHRNFMVYTERGIVAVDAFYLPSHMKGVMEMTKKETGRNDYVYFVNTHAHACHVGGLAHFSNITRIAHDSMPANLERVRSYHRHKYKEIKAKHKSEQDSTQQSLLSEFDLLFKIPDPQITFNDRLSLDMGDVHINLIYFGNSGHSNDEVLVHIIEEKVLLVGQIFHGAPTIPIIRSKVSKNDMLLKISVLNELLEYDWKHIYSSHQGEISLDDLIFMRDYYMDLFENMEVLVDTNKSYDEVTDFFSIENKYPELLERLVMTRELLKRHEDNVKAVWDMYNREKSRPKRRTSKGNI